MDYYGYGIDIKQINMLFVISQDLRELVALVTFRDHLRPSSSVRRASSDSRWIFTNYNIYTL